MAGKRPVNSLLYGDVVFLYCKTGGYVFSEISNTTRGSIIVYPAKDEDDPDFPNLTMGAFKVLAADKVKAQQRLADIRKNLEIQGEDTLSIEEKKEILLSAKRNAEVEVRNNKAEQERVAGTPVLYGNTIQLLHLFSGKYVAVDLVEISKTESINLQVELTTVNSENAFFKILPRYKVKSVGHQVYLHDQVIFGVVKSTEGQFLHTSRVAYRDVDISLYGECCEVNVASIPSGYTLKLHHHVILDDKRQNVVKGGSVIRLFHRAVEYYLVAEGSFANSKGEVVVEDVHLRKRKSDNGKLRVPSTSAITYWQIEKDKPTLSGEPIGWEERCRIKHVPTRMYLAVVKDENNSLKVTLKSRDLNKPDLDTVFRLIPVIEEDSEIMLESYARINHPLTNSWLSAKTSTYVRQKFDNNATGFDALQWDTAELSEIGVTSEMNYHDAFTVEEVDDSLVHKFNCIAEVIPIIKAYLEEREKNPEKPTSFQDAYVVIEALGVMTKFIGSGHADLLDRQKLLRNLMVIELIIQILKNHNTDLSCDSPQHMVSKACYQVLEAYLKGKSGKNNIYLARFIPLFREHIGLDLNVEDMMIELVNDCEEIILGYLEEEIRELINLLLRTKDSRFMDLLSALCVCNSRPIVEHQDYIVENLLYQYNKKLFYSTGVGSDLSFQTGSPYTIYFCKPDELAQKSIHSIAPDSEDFQFILAQFNLFGKLCKGNNRKAIEAIDKDLKFVTFAQALTGARDDNIDFSLRSKYVELIIVMYVDTNDNNRAILEELPLSFNYSEIRENPHEEASKNPTVALTGAKNIYFPDIRDWILDHLTAEQNPSVGGKEGSNTFNAKVVDLLYLLIKYGYYANVGDINSLMPPLLYLLDGKNDKPSTQAPKEEIKEVDRFKNTEENRPIFKLKVKLLKTMNLFFNFRFYIRLQKYIFDYKLLKSGAQASRLITSSPNHHTFFDSQEFSWQYSLPPPQLVQLEGDPEKVSIHKNKHLMSMAVNRLEKIFSFSEYSYEKLGQDTLPSVLLDLAKYEDDEILTESLHLLDRYYSSQDTLFEKAIQTQLLENPNSEKVLAEVTNELLPALRHLTSKDINAKQFQELIRIIRKLTSFCHLKDAVHEPHYQNQQILYNTGVFLDMMNLIFRKKLKSKSGKQDSMGKSQQKTIISTSLQFLKMLARNYKVVQEHLFDYIDKFLTLEIALPDVGELLTEVFTGVKEICLNIKEKHIEKIFKLISKHNGCPELLETLQAVVKAEDLDLPLRQNQTVIVKHFNLNRKAFCDSLLELKKEQERESLLLYAEDSDHDLQVFLKVIGLLAACCEGGNNLFIESICQSIISVNELMKILNNHKIKLDRKKPIALFLLWGYINTGKNTTQTGSIQLTHSQEMWGYLEHINSLLDGIIRILSNLPKAQVAFMKLTSNSQLRRRTRKIGGGAQHDKGNVVTTHFNVPYVTSSNGELIPGVLEYVMEGVLPLIKVYYSRLFDPCKDHSVHQKEIQVSAGIAGALLRLADVMVTNECFSSQKHWRTLCDTIITVISHDCYNEGMIDVDIDIKARFNEHMQARFSGNDSYEAVVQSNAAKVYSQEYKKEKELNENFNNFVHNFQRAYWGPNTAKHQINSPYTTKYSEFVDGAEFKEKGDEWLPLGSMYQKHVACFVSREESKTTVHPVTKRVINYLLTSYDQFGSLTEKKQILLRMHNLKYLRLLRTIIYNEIMFIDSTLSEQGQNPQEFRRQSERVREVQDQIQKYGDGSTVIKLVRLLSHPDESISAEVLAFLTIILYSGNINIQNSFSTYLLDTREEIFFVNMQQRLEQAASNDSKRRVLLDQLKQKHDEELILKDLYAEYAVQYGFNKALPALFAQPNFKQRLSSIEEDPFADQSTKRRLLEKGDDTHLESQSSPKRVLISGANVIYGGTSAIYTKLTTMTARRLSQQTVTIQRESIPGVRIAKDEIYQQKQEGLKDEKSAEHSKLAALKFRDTSYIELILRFLGLLCDGQNRTMQNYFREQPDNIKTINLVSETCVFLQSFYVEVTKENIDLITEVLLTLIEICVGNFANQKVIYNHHIVDVVNRLLQTPVFHQCKLSKVLKLKSTAVKVLEIMCEETSPLTKDLVIKVFKAVDVDALHTSLAYFYKLSQDKDMKHSKEDDDAERAMSTTYQVLIHFADFQGISKEMIEPKSPAPERRHKEINKAWTLCKKQSKSIELSYEDDGGEITLAKVHFRVPESNELSEEIKEKVKINVDRTSPEDKIRDFSKWIESVKKEVQHLNYLRALWYTKIFMKRIQWRNRLLFFWTLLMNILMLIAWNDSLPERVSNGTDIAVPTVPRQTGNWFFPYILYIGGGIHLLISLVVTITYFLINGSNFVLPDFIYRLFRKKHDSSYSDVPFFGLRTMYHIAFVIFSVLSLVFYGYFYCVCLFHIVVDNDILQRVLKSVTKNGSSLLWVAALGMIVIYNYAVGTFVFMPNEFDSQEEGEVVRYCQTLFECSVTVLEYGLLDTIGLTVDLPTNLKDATLRAIFYDLSFFIIVTTIGLNIVFGIIVDTFSELRDERYNIDQDKKGYCFICNISSFEFERRAKGFNSHVREEHCMWDYIYYIMYLEGIDISDHNAIEHYVCCQIKDKNTGYFPLFQARSLREKKDEALTELGELKKMMSVIVEHHQEMQRSEVVRRNKEDQVEWERKYQTEQTDELLSSHI